MSALSAPLLARLAMRAGGPAMPADREAAGLVDGDELLARLEQAEGRSTLELTGEWATDRREGDPPGPLLREHVLAIAGRNGWRCQDAEPRGDAVLAVRQRLRAALQTHAAVLAADGFDAAAALRELAGREQALAAGRSVIERLRLTRADVEPVGQLVAVDAARSEAMRTLFEAVFRHPMTAEHWAWKYGGGRGHAVGLVQDGRLVAHYGGLSRELRLFGRPARGCQVCDVMVAPQANRSLARRGPMQRIAATFLELQIGNGLPHEVGFGFPSRRHHGVADRLQLYAAVDRIVQLSWPSAVAPSRAPWRLQAMYGDEHALSPPQAAAVQALWAAMASDLADLAVGVRDARWLAWRYRQRPGIRYELWLLLSRWWRRPLAALALRQHTDSLELLDLVAPARHFDAALAAARALAHERGLPLLRCWITASQMHRLAASDAAPPMVKDPGIHVPCNVHTPALPSSALENRWFLMGGDADFT